MYKKISIDFHVILNCMFRKFNLNISTTINNNAHMLTIFAIQFHYFHLFLVSNMLAKYYIDILFTFNKLTNFGKNTLFNM